MPPITTFANSEMCSCEQRITALIYDHRRAYAKHNAGEMLLPAPCVVCIIHERDNLKCYKKVYSLTRGIPNLMMFCSSRGWTLVALGEKTKCVNLLDEIGHTSPPSQSKANHKYPYHYKCIQYVHGCPAWEEDRRFLNCILHLQQRNKQFYETC